MITMWVRDKINNLYLGSKTIEKGTQSTKIRALIDTNPTFLPVKCLPLVLTAFRVSSELVTLCYHREAACVHRDMSLAGTNCVDHFFQRIALFSTGICSSQLWGQKAFLLLQSCLYVRANHLWNMYNLAPNAIVEACKSRCRKVEMCLGWKPFQLIIFPELYFWRRVNQTNFSPDWGAKLFLTLIQKTSAISGTWKYN